MSPRAPLPRCSLFPIQACSQPALATNVQIILNISVPNVSRQYSLEASIASSTISGGVDSARCMRAFAASHVRGDLQLALLLLVKSIAFVGRPRRAYNSNPARGPGAQPRCAPAELRSSRLDPDVRTVPRALQPRQAAGSTAAEPIQARCQQAVDRSRYALVTTVNGCGPHAMVRLLQRRFDRFTLIRPRAVVTTYKLSCALTLAARARAKLGRERAPRLGSLLYEVSSSPRRIRQDQLTASSRQATRRDSWLCPLALRAAVDLIA